MKAKVETPQPPVEIALVASRSQVGDAVELGFADGLAAVRAKHWGELIEALGAAANGGISSQRAISDVYHCGYKVGAAERYARGRVAQAAREAAQEVATEAQRECVNRAARMAKRAAAQAAATAEAEAVARDEQAAMVTP